jgi:hypothetical protein
MDASTLRERATDAIRYWEPRRILYNLVLAAIVLAYFVIGLPGSKHTVTLDFIFLLFLLAVLANVCYCAAYVVDIFAQTSGFRDVWQRYRLILFLVGTAFAGIITRFWAMAFFVTPR